MTDDALINGAQQSTQPKQQQPSVRKLTVNDMKQLMQVQCSREASRQLETAMKVSLGNKETAPVMDRFFPLLLAKRQAHDGTWPLLTPEARRSSLARSPVAGRDVVV